MSSSRKPSPARSQGIPAIMVTSPRPRKSRRSRSVCSATSSTSLRMTAVIPDSFQMSPLAVGMSVLNDNTDIQIPGRQSWWKKLGTNSRDVTEIMEEQEKGVIMTEEFDVEILSQEKENVSVDLPDSSDCESIQSIVIPQRKLFADQDNRPQKKLKVTVNSKETLVKMRNSYLDHTNIDKDIDVMPKKLFNQAPKPKTKPVFTAELLNASANKTVNVNKSIKQPEQEVQGQVHNLFGNRPGTKRKNIYAQFLVSDSEDEIPEIQPRVFGLQKKVDHQQAFKQPRKSSSQVSVHSSTSNMTDVEIDDWQHLPSSTMVEHQLEDPETPLKRTSLSRLSRPRDSDITSIKNNSINKSKRSDSEIIYPESEEIHKINTRSQSLNGSKDKSIIVINNNKSLRESTNKSSSNLAHNVSKNKTLTEKDIQANLVNEEHEKTLTEENQHSDEVADENFTLEYENEDDNFFHENGEGSQNKSNKETYDGVDLNKTDTNSQKCNDSHIILEITEKQSANVVIDNHQNDNNLIEKSNQSQTEHNDMHEEVVDEVNKYRSKENESNESKQGQTTDSKEQSRNLTTGKSKNIEVLKSPEAVLHNKSNRGESFTKHGRHTSMSKSKTMIKDLSIRPSLAPARESTGLIDGTINSSAEGSGWDSHRTTRKTLRQTFGKDFTPRKSLRTLVMERAAKQQTNQIDQVADRSKRKSNFNEATDKSKGVNTIANKSIHQTSLKENANLSKRLTYFGDITNKRPIANSTELPDFDQEQDEESDNEPKENNVESNQQAEQNEMESDREPEQNEEIESDQEAEHNKESEQEVESDQEAEQNDIVESDQEPEQNEEVESDQEREQSKEVKSDQEAEHNHEVESEQEAEQNDEVESEQEAEQNDIVGSNQEPERNEEIESDQDEEVESDQEPEQSKEVESDQELEHNKEVESDQEVEQTEEVESEQEPEQNEEIETDIETDETEEFESYREPEPLEIDERDEQVDDEASKQSRLAALQNFLQKVKLENAENRRQIQEKVMNSLKVPRQPFKIFKMPEVPKPKRATKTIKKETKTKLNPSLFSNELPPEFFEDLKYKPPKRFQGKNAPWITKRLYKFLEDKLRPKYDYHARVRAEKLVETLYLFAKDVRKCARAAPPQAISELKYEMARLGIVDTHYQFYSFFHEFMPREIRIRVNPDIMNKIPKPRDVFGNIIEETQDDE